MILAHAIIPLKNNPMLYIYSITLPFLKQTSDFIPLDILKPIFCFHSEN